MNAATVWLRVLHQDEPQQPVSRQWIVSIFSFIAGLFRTGPDRTISYDDLVAATDAGSVRIIDVREKREFDTGHLLGAKNVPLARFKPLGLPRDKPIVLICLSGSRSASALRKAAAVGRDDIRHFAGGTRGWARRGGRLV